VNLELAAWLSTLVHCVSYTLFNVGKEVLYVPTDSQVKYRFKAVNDAFGYRLGNATVATYIMACRVIAETRMFLGLNAALMGLCLAWLPLIWIADRAYHVEAKGAGSGEPMAVDA
jgi:ATP/ADP translocase